MNFSDIYSNLLTYLQGEMRKAPCAEKNCQIVFPTIEISVAHNHYYLVVQHENGRFETVDLSDGNFLQWLIGQHPEYVPPVETPAPVEAPARRKRGKASADGVAA